MADDATIQQEFNQLLEQGAESQPTGDQPIKEEVEALEFALGEQKLKVPVNTEIPVKHNGQIVNAPLEKLLNAFRQQSHVEDKFKELNQKRGEFEEQQKKFGDFDALRKKYEAIQTWSEQNPDQWTQLWDMFQNRDQHLVGQSADPNNALIQELAQVKQKLSEFDSFRSELQKQQEEAEIQADVKAIESEIEEFKKEFPGLDLDEKDLDGVTLQGRIIKHGIDRQYPDFKSAAFTFPGLMTKLRETAVANGRNEAVKAVKQDHKDGVVARSSTPFFGQGEFDPRKMDEDTLTETALAELNQLMANT